MIPHTAIKLAAIKFGVTSILIKLRIIINSLRHSNLRH